MNIKKYIISVKISVFQILLGLHWYINSQSLLLRKLQHNLTLRYFEEPLEELIWRVHQYGEGSDEVEEEQDLHRHLDRAVAQGVDHTAVYADQQTKYVKQSLMQNL